MKLKFQRKKYLFTFAVVIFPILSMYNTPGFSILPLSDTFLIISIILSAHRSQIPRINYWVILPFFVTSFLSLISFIWNGFDSTVLTNFLHFAFCILVISIFIDDWFDFSIAFKIFKLISIFSIIFLIIQYLILSLRGQYISGAIPFLTIRNEDIISFNNTAILGSRARSIFSEPSTFVNYISIYLAIELFDKRHKLSILAVLLAFVGIVISKSSSGYVFAAIISLFWVYDLIHRPNSKKVLVFIASLLFIPILLIGSGGLDYVIEHVGGTSGTLGQGVGFINRFVGYDHIFDFSKYDFVQFIFGNGMVETMIFTTAAAKIFLFFGLLGVAFSIWYLISSYFKLNYSGKCILYMMIVQAVFADSIFGLATMSYVPYLIKLAKEEESNYD
ncbi:hypothetical protein MX009_03350 [Streptococcus uberis]|uniref:hypothetical protein n=1 Tax=Streptococcus uberis TaxID=1349 RepID=UPI001FF695B0|nr:hypothetical protein [Streptococcus uberis]MCK1229447.1 hypothetical protein [Streptococcus uberis]